MGVPSNRPSNYATIGCSRVPAPHPNPPPAYPRSFIYAITPLFPHFCTSLRISPVGSALRTTTRFRGTTECEEMVRSADPTQLLFMREVTALMKYLGSTGGGGKRRPPEKLADPSGQPEYADNLPGPRQTNGSRNISTFYSQLRRNIRRVDVIICFPACGTGTI